MLACVITAFYEVVVEQEMIIKALAMDNYRWLLFLWVFEKNYIGPRLREDAHRISYEQLFDLILKQHNENPMEAESHIKEVLDWKILTEDDNVLVGLLVHGQDAIAIDYMGYYSDYLDKDLFIACLKQGNNVFLQKALLVAAFDKLIFREEAVIE